MLMKQDLQNKKGASHPKVLCYSKMAKQLLEEHKAEESRWMRTLEIIKQNRLPGMYANFTFPTRPEQS